MGKFNVVRGFPRLQKMPEVAKHEFWQEFETIPGLAKTPDAVWHAL